MDDQPPSAESTMWRIRWIAICGAFRENRGVGRTAWPCGGGHGPGALHRLFRAEQLLRRSFFGVDVRGPFLQPVCAALRYRSRFANAPRFARRDWASPTRNLRVRHSGLRPIYWQRRCSAPLCRSRSLRRRCWQRGLPAPFLLRQPLFSCFYPFKDALLQTYIAPLRPKEIRDQLRQRSQHWRAAEAEAVRFTDHIPLRMEEFRLRHADAILVFRQYAGRELLLVLLGFWLLQSGRFEELLRSRRALGSLLLTAAPPRWHMHPCCCCLVMGRWRGST